MDERLVVLHQSFTDDRDFVGSPLGLDQAPIEELNLPEVPGQKSQAGAQPLRAIGGGSFDHLCQEGFGPSAIGRKIFDDFENRVDVGRWQPSHQGMGRVGGSSVRQPLKNSPAEKDLEQEQHAGLEQALPRGHAHHLALRLGPVFVWRQEKHVQPLPAARQMARLGLETPDGGKLREADFHPSAPGLTLFARQPLPQRGDEIIVGEMVIAGERGVDRRRGRLGRKRLLLGAGGPRCGARTLPLARSFGIGRRDEP